METDTHAMGSFQEASSLNANNPVLNPPDIDTKMESAEHENYSIQKPPDRDAKMERTTEVAGVTVLESEVKESAGSLTLGAGREGVISSSLTQASMLHEQSLQLSARLSPPECELPGSSSSRQSTEVSYRTLLSSETGATLFQLMDIRCDRQDLSYVEKIILPREQIVSFCHALRAESTREQQEGQVYLKFDQLDQRSLNVVGFYGSKNLMVEILEKCKAIIPGDLISGKMREDLLSPGLYALLHEQTLRVFYWHCGSVLSSASRKDISCNFVRYLIDLCDSVFVLPEAEAILETFNGSVPRPVQPARTRKMRIEKIKATENSIKLIPGFSLQVDPVKIFNDLTEVSESTRRLICEGDRCGFPSFMVNPPGNASRVDSRIVTWKDGSSWQEIFGGKSIDFSNLRDEDLRLFLHCSGCSVGEEYAKLERRFLEEEASLRFKQDEDREQRLTIYEEQVHERTSEFLTIYMAQRFPWEEAMLAGATLEELESTPFSPDSVLRERGLSMNSGVARSSIPALLAGRFRRLSRYLTGLVPGLVSRNPQTDYPAETRDPELDELERSIWTAYGNDTHRFIFPTNTVRVFPLRQGQKQKPQIYTIQDADHGGPTSHGPILYNRRVILRPLLSPETGIAFCTFKPKNGEAEGPVLTNIVLLCDSWGRLRSLTQGEFILEIPEDEFYVGGLQQWVASEVDKVLTLGRKAALLSAALDSTDTGRQGTVWSDSTIQKVLSSTGEASHLVLEHSPDQLHAGMKRNRRRWEELCKGESASTRLSERVVHQCKAVYEKTKRDYFGRFHTVIRRYFRKVLGLSIQQREEEEWRLLNEELQKQEVVHLRRLRQQQAMLNKNQKVVKLLSCRRNRGPRPEVEGGSAWKHSRRGNQGQVKLCLEYMEEVLQNEKITCDVVEFVPSKFDTDSLQKDPDYNFAPKFCSLWSVLELNSSHDRLLKLAFLKTGQFLAFILSSTAQTVKLQIVLIVPRSERNKSSLIHTMDHGFDLISFNENSRFLGFYDKLKLLIRVYRFEDEFKRLEFSGAEVCLQELGITNVIWMELIPGREEIVFVDSNYNIRVFEMAAPGMVRAKSILLPGPFVSAQVTDQGPCLLVFNLTTSTTDYSFTSPTLDVLGIGVASLSATVEPSGHDASIQMDVYSIDDSMSHMSTLSVYKFKHINIPKLNFRVAVHSFGPQEHLLVCTEDEPQVVRSQILKITSASEVLHLNSNSTLKIGTAEQPRSAQGQALDYLYHVYEKYSTNPPLVKQSRTLSIHVVLHQTKLRGKGLKAHCLNYLESCFRKLQNEKGKNFGCLDIHTFVHDLSEVSPLLTEHGKLPQGTKTMGIWLRKLLCLVPIQIARAENNSLRPLADGVELSADADYVDSVSLANVIRFGFYEAVFASWQGPLKVISSMGKQSSGKSYLLNHLSGSLLDVSGGRCTDGVWMTVRISDGFLYVLLDFEGLGTFERSEQEDMLLSVLNAAISDMTIYNKKDFNLDKETEHVFQRFQNGVALVKDDHKLFSGRFYMAIKDVGTADVDDLQEELERKIKKILGNSTDNFLTRMYGGDVEVATMAAFDTPDYYRSIEDIRDTICLLSASYNDGAGFSTDLKLLIAQLCAKDWAPLDSRRMALRLNLMRSHLSSAISRGCLNCRGSEVNLVNFDSQQEIVDHPVRLDSVQFCVKDTGLKLQPCVDGESSGDILKRLKLLFQDVLPRSGDDDESWFSGLGSFVDALVDRRKSRVLEWLSCNLENFHEQDETQVIRLEAVASCAELKQNLLLCSCKCAKCFLKCTREKGHTHSHNCLGDHVCSQNCTYCGKDHVDSPGSVNSCNDVAGHAGLHDCKLKSHTCQEICVYEGLASNCNRNCAGAVGHAGEHLCNSRQHMCSQTCSLPSCNNQCVSPFEVQDHSPHACHEKYCPKQCSMFGCNRVCASQDHFHDGVLNGTHFCGYPHPCPEPCEARGNCAVQQDLIRTTKTFRGKYGSFEYEHVAEQNGIRKDCCIEIPPFQTTHEGLHSHTLNENVVHLCDRRCHSCGYFCVEPIGHAGLHKTIHGNMRGVTFAAETEKIEMEDRTYAWGESGAAEMCNMYCRSQGRGHIHLIECPSARSEQDQAGVCYSKLYQEGVRHETKEYGPHPKVPEDEMAHAAYWRHMRFTDPCSKEEQTLFGLCGHECTSQEHMMTSDASANKELRMSKKSFCTLKLWHQPVSTSRQMLQGHITVDGHQMECSHLKLSNVIFVIDRSGSMSSKDMTPNLVQFQATHSNRLGCVYEAILRFVRTRLSLQQGQVTDLVSVVLFNRSAVTAVEPRDMNESFLTELLRYTPNDCTVFSKGLKEAEKILLSSYQEAFAIDKIPVVIFLSDGENWNDDIEATMSCIRTMKSRIPELVLHTVIFGRHSGATDLMKKMANAGDGTFNISIDELELSKTFVQLARSLKPRVVALI